MTLPSPPTSLRGRVSQYDDGFNAVLEELTQDLPPDLVWPLSVPMYATMSRESHLSAILTAYELQLRRAQWQLDGRGCRPEVVRHVADDMGLLVAGEDDPGGARTRGVSWNEHLRAALMSLRFGHAAFEMLAEVVDGRARLVALAERMPWTITDIHVDPALGTLLGISQDQVRVARDRSPQIKADRLAFYCHERVGPNWAGTSLLRNSYAPWLIKREMVRVHSIANRRWAAGVPVMEALPGTNPTGAQMIEAQQMASAARAGDQAGAATPPGFTMKIVGMSGGVPDTLAFLEFLNREMSRAALMGHIEMGMGDSSGSRALGTAVLDSWTLALETLAEGIADTATRQVAARIVEWNWGADEPVPRVVCSGIGSRREVTAESLQLLLSSGALSADPGLEAWIRREYRLPEREESVPPPAPVVAASVSAKPRRRREKTGQLALPIAAASGDVTTAQEQWSEAKADLLAAWPRIAAPVVDNLTVRARQAVDTADLGALGALTVAPAVVAAVAEKLGDTAAQVASQAAAGITADAAAHGITIAVPDVEPQVRQTVSAIAGLIASGYAAAAARTALQAPADAVADAVREHLTDLAASDRGFVADHLGAMLSAAQGAGRVAAIRQARPTRIVADESNDANTCGPCRQVADRDYPDLEAALADYPTGAGYRHCEGGWRCRGQLVPIWT